MKHNCKIYNPITYTLRNLEKCILLFI